MNGRRAKKRAQLDDGPGLDLLDEVLEDCSVGAPPFDPLGTEEISDVRRREAIVWGGGVENSVEDGLPDGFRRNRVAAVGCDSEVIELVGKIGPLLD